MMKHDRFSPVLLAVPTPGRDGEIDRVKKYLEDKGYQYIEVAKQKRLKDYIKPDIIFYQQPYYGVIEPKNDFLRNLDSLFCYVHYAFHTLDDDWLTDQAFFNFCWQVYFENDLARQSSAALMYNNASNAIVTGMPYVDDYYIGNLQDPWPEQSKSKKRIIWAPHHSIPGTGHLAYSTFLEYSDFMLEMADKYKNDIQIAFKPHPSLENKLIKIWGEEKTKQYYKEWESRENTQLELGKYADLFKYSDAMIHDCVSFSVEYHYTQNPVMMLVNDTPREEKTNKFARLALDMHYQGKNKKDIEDFIINVINGKDDMKSERGAFYQNYLLPPNGIASDSIIDSILNK
ncbi:MAG: CDP-glycerol glycerophosphotransferase family protein [Bacteroidales bacterium]|nr:CDP-glycerol glycerophosphotransferase family protein [Bacteroidales bacterium]